VTLESLQEKRVLNITGKDKKLPLKVLGEGELPFAMTIHATAFSDGAKAAIESGGGSIVEVPKKVKWTRKAAKANGKSK
jgi:large subunit ribosomal protein L15